MTGVVLRRNRHGKSSGQTPSKYHARAGVARVLSKASLCVRSTTVRSAVRRDAKCPFARGTCVRSCVGQASAFFQRTSGEAVDKEDVMRMWGALRAGGGGSRDRNRAKIREDGGVIFWRCKEGAIESRFDSLDSRIKRSRVARVRRSESKDFRQLYNLVTYSLPPP